MLLEGNGLLPTERKDRRLPRSKDWSLKKDSVERGLINKRRRTDGRNLRRVLRSIIN